MYYNMHFHSFSHGIRHIASHIVITLLAVGAAFSLPKAAQYILYQWWPRVASDPQLMLVTEIGFAALLMLLLNTVKTAWDSRRSRRLNRIASLVYAREKSGWLSRWGERVLRRKFLTTRDISIFSITGYHTFSADNCKLRQQLEDSYEIRVMLMNPDSEGAARHINSLGDPAPFLETYRRETEASIAYLKKLAAAGKKITLKLYEDQPFWKLVVTGEYVWVQYCRDGHEIKDQPEYVFALQRDNPARGFFAPFYTFFLNQWDDPRHPEYSLETDELIYRNGLGNEVRRIGFTAKD